MKKLLLAVCACVALASPAAADSISGSYGGFILTGSYDPSTTTLALTTPEFNVSGFGDFTGSALTFNVASINTSGPVTDYFTISGPGGTFDFNLASADISTPYDYFNAVLSGTLVDTATTNPLASTPATVTIGGTGLSGSFTIGVTATPTPEPSTWILMLGGLGIMPFLMRRKSRS